MEIPVIESGIARFQSPNLAVHVRALWTWAALIIAAVATFSSLVRRAKRVFLRFRRVKSVIALPSASPTYFSDADDDDLSSCSSSDEEEEEEEIGGDDESERDLGDFEGIQGQNGKYKEEEDFEWDEGRSVVKLWGGGDGGSADIVDPLRADQVLRCFLWGPGGNPAVHVAPNGTVVMAGENDDAWVKVWDARAAGERPAVEMSATWLGQGIGRLVRVGGGEGRVCLVDDGGRLTVVDLRMGAVVG